MTLKKGTTTAHQKLFIIVYRKTASLIKTQQAHIMLKFIHSILTIIVIMYICLYAYIFFLLFFNLKTISFVSDICCAVIIPTNIDPLKSIIYTTFIQNRTCLIKRMILTGVLEQSIIVLSSWLVV